MRYAIISDIHSNLEALQAVLKDARDQGARRIYCLGDIVGYGANPNECIEELEKYKVQCVAGNHDWAVAGKLNYEHFTDEGRAAIDWTKTALKISHLEYLKNLNLSMQNDDMNMVHANLHYPDQFIYLKDSTQAQDTFYLMDKKVCFIGHTHVPQTLVFQDGMITISKLTEITLLRENKYIVNVGSVGQPRDGNPFASYCLYDPDLERIQIKRIAYDIPLTQKSIYESGLPTVLAKRLEVGE